MKYAIEMYFDKATEKKIINLAEKVAKAGISTKYLEWKTRPHITLGVFNDVDEKRCTELLRQFAASHRQMNAHLHSVAAWSDTKVIYLNPCMTRWLYDLHDEIYELMKEFDTQSWEQYMPESWVAHCTVALTAGDGEKAIYQANDLILREFTKIDGLYTSVGLVRITFPVEELATFDFQ